jgi:hypothetical protein
MRATPSCPRESDVIELATLGHWPAFADDGLKIHVGQCGICGEVARVAAAMADWRDAPTGVIQLPDASRVWREAERRARLEAMRQATRPVLAAEVAAAAVAALLLLAVGPGLWSTVVPIFTPTEDGLPLSMARQALEVLRSLAASPWDGLARLAPPVRWSLLALAGWAVLLSVALSLASLADWLPQNRRHSGPVR